MTIPIPVTGSGPNVKLSTPLSVIGMFIAIVRERFREGVYSDPPLPWSWVPDATGNTDKVKTGIFIESGWNENLEGRNVRPGVWVERDQNVYSRSVIGDQDQMPVEFNIRLENFFCFGEMDIILECTAPKRGESMEIGSVVQTFIQMSARIIMAKFGLRDMSPVVMNRTTVFDKDDKLWSTPVQFRIGYEDRWATLPVAEALNALTLRIADVTDPEKYFRELVLH